MSQAILGDLIEQPPTDGISQLKFSHFTDLLLASSWDGTVRLYDAVSRTQKAVFNQHVPVLDVAFPDDGVAYTASLDGRIKRLGLQVQDEYVIGSHGAAVKCVDYIASRGLVVSGSWDQTLKVWDPRAPPQQNLVKAIPLPGKVYTMSTTSDKLVVGTSGRHVLIFDIRKLEFGQPEQHRESSLKYQTRTIACYTDGQGYALGSVEGRVAMEFFDLGPEAQANKYAFKCHRRTEEGKGDVVYPVHAITFHPGYGTFATGGGDGVINLWDGANKKRLFQISKYPTSVAAMSFSRDGSMLAVASSYAYERGEIPHEPDAIYIRKMQDMEVRPKQKK